MKKFDSENLLESLYAVDGIREVLEHNQTEENRIACEPFEQLNQKFVTLQRQYTHSFKALNKDMESRVCRRAYSKGGKTLHRGFYSPSSLDLVVEGNRRGRLLKNPPEGNTYDYEYLFDDGNNLIGVKKYSHESDGVFRAAAVELFAYEQERVLAFEFDPCHKYVPYFISECQYENGRLARYETALCGVPGQGKDCIEINVEIPGYEDALLKSVLWYRYVPCIQLLDGSRYIFSRDETGRLSEYTVEDFADSSQKDVEDTPTFYKVKVKRK